MPGTSTRRGSRPVTRRATSTCGSSCRAWTRRRAVARCGSAASSPCSPSPLRSVPRPCTRSRKAPKASDSHRGDGIVPSPLHPLTTGDTREDQPTRSPRRPPRPQHARHDSRRERARDGKRAQGHAKGHAQDAQVTEPGGPGWSRSPSPSHYRRQDNDRFRNHGPVSRAHAQAEDGSASRKHRFHAAGDERR